MAKKIGTVLKESRIRAGISIEQISGILTEKGYKTSIKTGVFQKGSDLVDILHTL